MNEEMKALQEAVDFEPYSQNLRVKNVDLSSVIFLVIP